jgi:polysaccharide export outer membrane protein
MYYSDDMEKRVMVKNSLKSWCLSNLLARMGTLLLVFLAGGIFSLIALPVGAQQQEPADINEVYKFGVGDVLEVLVFNEPEISKTVFVRNDGRIALPLIGEFMAAGTTPETLAEKIREKLMKVVAEPNVTVILTENNSKVYYILGQIEEPGLYTITRPITVLQAIARAGGFLEWAKKSRIMIVSGPKTSEKITYFNYDDFLGGDNIGQNVVINPEDTIVVP